MKINRANYEAFLLDLAEGRLSAEERKMLRDFLLCNPDCASELPDLESWVLEKDEIIFSGKEALKKYFPAESSVLTDADFDLFSIARLENDLSPEQEKSHAALVAADEEKRKEWLGWKKTKLVPPRVVYPGKNDLKKKAGISRRVIWMGILSAAAAVALLVVLTRSREVIPDSILSQETELRETDPAGAEIPEILKMEASRQTTPGQEMLAGDPVSLSVKKKPDPPESDRLAAYETNTDLSVESGIHPVIGSGDTVSMTGRDHLLPERMRIALLERSTPDIVREGVYDRITPLELPPGSVHPGNISLTRISEMDLQQLFEDFTEENEISIWSIANSGIRGFNRITGADISLMAQKDEEGDYSGVLFKSRRFSFSTRVPDAE